MKNDKSQRSLYILSTKAIKVLKRKEELEIFETKAGL
jgi:hypothetical protein